MSFAYRWRIYRQDKLNISSKQAAYALGLKPTTYSNYETELRPFPIHIVLAMQKTFSISDDEFFEILIGKKRLKEKLSEDNISAELYKIKTRYHHHLGEELLDFLLANSELTTTLLLLKNKNFNDTALRSLAIKFEKLILSKE